MTVGTVATATTYTVAIVSTAAASAAGAAVVFDVPAAALPNIAEKFLLLMPRAVTGWFCKKEVSAVLLFCFSPVVTKLSLLPKRFSATAFRFFVDRALEQDCCLRPIGQRPNRMWPGWDQRPRPRSVWSGLSRSFNILIRREQPCQDLPLCEEARPGPQ